MVEASDLLSREVEFLEGSQVGRQWRSLYPKSGVMRDVDKQPTE